MPITVYSTPSCVQCNLTKKALNKLSLEYDEIDLVAYPEAAEYVKSLGYMQAPVVIAGEDHWSGFQPDRIEALVA